MPDKSIPGLLIESKPKDGCQGSPNRDGRKSLFLETGTELDLNV